MRYALLLFGMILPSCASEPQPPRFAAPAPSPTQLSAQSGILDIRNGSELRRNAWTLKKDANPAVFTVELPNQAERREVCFLSGDQSLCRMVATGDQFDFLVTYQGVEYPQRIVGVHVPPAAIFDAAYQAANRGKLTVEVPEVYELVNIAIALTPTARADANMVMKDTPYYRELIQFFAPAASHPLVNALEQRLKARQGDYFTLKMNGYAFLYDASGKIVRSPVYDRTGFVQGKTNSLLPFLELMNSFSRDANFRQFYSKHRKLYESQGNYLRSEVNVERMLRWLRANFPQVKPYDTTKIIFSPLVNRNQSVTYFESNGFTELQPHVNFPYPRPDDDGFSPAALAVKRGNILFTEINHGFINPTQEPLVADITQAMGERGTWVVPKSAADGGQVTGIFNEMMNWGLVDLYYTDFAPAAEVERLIAANRKHQHENRGFRRYPEFSQFLVSLYRNRPAGTTIADLYPQIIRWFSEHRSATPTAPNTSGS